MRISVIVCTYDRPGDLERTVAGLVEQSMPDRDYEVVVVYDRDVPATRAVVERLSRTHDLVRAVPENDRPRPEFVDWGPRVADGGERPSGLSHARNVGTAVADGEYVYFLDDDARPTSERVVERTHEAFVDTSPDPVCVGGRIVPAFEGTVPEWLPASRPGIPTCELGTEPRWIRFPEESVIGANLAFDRAFVRSCGGFPESLGRQQGRLLGGEEMPLIARAARERGVYYQPGATVAHRIGAERLTLQHLLRLFFWRGVSNYRIGTLETSYEPVDYAGDSPSVYRRAVRETAALLSALARGEERDATEKVFAAANVAGYAVEAARSRVTRSASSQPEPENTKR